MDPDKLVSPHDGVKEEAAVTPAQHPSSLTGKCWTREHGEPELNDQDLPVPTYVPWLHKTVEHPEGYGIYFQQPMGRGDQGQPAVPLHQRLERMDGRQVLGGVQRLHASQQPIRLHRSVQRRVQPRHLADEGRIHRQLLHADGREYPALQGRPADPRAARLRLDQDRRRLRGLEQASSVEYRDTIGDTAHRDYNGYGGLHYTNDSGRNDIITCKVAVDGDNVYFYAETDSAADAAHRSRTGCFC